MAKAGDKIDFVGAVDTIVWADNDPDKNGFAVLRILVDDEYRERIDDRLTDKKHRVTISGGNLAHLRTGEKLQINGEVVKHKTYGLQVKVESYLIAQPKHLHEIERFLCGHVHLINTVLARRIINKFGFDTLAVISNEPKRLLEIEGIGEKRLAEIVECWEKQTYERELLIFFTNIGLSSRFKDQIVKLYGDAAVRVIKQDPYRLAREIDGIGFKTADEVAKRLNIPETSDVRIRAAALHLLDEQRQGDGHCFSYDADLVVETHRFLEHPMLTVEQVEEVINAAVDEKIIVRQDNRLYHPAMAHAEDISAARLHDLIKSPLPLMLQGERLQKAQQAAIESAQFQLDPVQEQAICNALSNKVSVITGGPGTGKTTVTRCIVAGLAAAGIDIHLVSPTGRASKRMSQVIGRRATTVHKRLADMNFKGAPPFSGCLLIDESSMKDIMLLAQTVVNTLDETIVIFVGDVDQLPSVGPGSVLRDLINSGVVNVTRLTKIFRQAENSDIVVNAHGINHGTLPRINRMGRTFGIPKNSDMLLWEVDDAERQAEAVRWLVTKFGPGRGFDPIRDTQVITAGHAGPVGVKSLNHSLQSVLNPSPACAIDVREGVRWGVGDRVMNFKNSEEFGLSNGDVGTIEEIIFDRTDNKPSGLVINFEGDYVEVPRDWFKNIHLAYASTVHKMQGSEVPFVVMTLHTSHYMLLQRNLLYTGVTRARKMCVLVANTQALGRALRNVNAGLRRTYLAEKLAASLQQYEQQTFRRAA